MKNSQVAEFCDVIELKLAIKDFQSQADNAATVEERESCIEWRECYERELASRNRRSVSESETPISPITYGYLPLSIPSQIFVEPEGFRLYVHYNMQGPHGSSLHGPDGAKLWPWPKGTIESWETTR